MNSGAPAGVCTHPGPHSEFGQGVLLQCEVLRQFLFILAFWPHVTQLSCVPPPRLQPSSCATGLWRHVIGNVQLRNATRFAAQSPSAQ